jgi:TPR repeat protein
LVLIRDAESAGCVEATTWLAAHLEDADPAEARATYLRAAKLGSADAMFQLGELSRQDASDEALEWYRQAAALEHPTATLRVAHRELALIRSGRWSY